MKNREDYICINELEFSFDPTMSLKMAISKLFMQAKLRQKAGPFAKYLFGAVLQNRFPKEKILNERYNTSVNNKGYLSDFKLGDTVFHVSATPNFNVMENCKQNVNNGYRVFLIVPEESVIGARQNAELEMPNKIAVESLESYVANNLEFLSGFDKNKLVSVFRRLLELYNSRVESIDPDKSLLIKIPRALE